MSVKYKYILYPGHIPSKHDIDMHYIDAPTLARLYGVDLKDCYVFREYGGNHWSPTMDGLPILEPRFHGDYDVKNCRKMGIGKRNLEVK